MLRQARRGPDNAMEMGLLPPRPVQDGSIHLRTVAASLSESQARRAVEPLGGIVVSATIVVASVTAPDTGCGLARRLSAA